MKALRKLAELGWRDWLLLAQATRALLLVRLALWLVPRPFVRRSLVERVILRSRDPRAPSVDRIVWAVVRARRLVPRATCLVQALAARILLARAGHQADLRIGVAKSRTGRFEAHAWLERNGRVLVGRVRELELFAALPISPREQSAP